MMRKIAFSCLVMLCGAALLFAGGTKETGGAAAAANFSPVGYPIVKTPITINLMYNKGPTSGDWNELIYMKEMEKLTGIKMNCIAVSGDSAAFLEKKNLAFASGDLPDLFWDQISIQDEFMYGVQGKVLQPYNDLIEKYGPNFKKTMGNYVGLKAKLSAADGKIYTLPYIADTLTIADSTLYMRADWLAQTGLKKPTSTTELYNVAKAFKALDATYIPISPYLWQTLKDYLITAFGPSLEAWYGADAQNKVAFMPATDQYKEMLKYCARLYAEKLLDNETFTQQQATVMAKSKDNKVGFMTFGTLLLPTNFKSGNYDVELLQPLTSEWVSKPRNRANPGMVSLGGSGMTTKNKYPEATMRWLDINYSDDDVAPGLNCLSVWLGIRGVTWDFTAADKSKYKRIIPADTKYSEVEYMTQKVSPGWSNCKLVLKAIPDGSFSQYMKATESVKNWYPFNQPAFPMGYMRYTKEESDRVGTLRTDLETYVKQMEAKFVSGTEPFTTWDTYLANLKKIGMDEFLKILQASYDRYLKNL